MQLDHDRLRERGDGHGFIDAGDHIKNPEFQRAKRGMRPNVPPDFFGVIDRVQPNQKFHVILVLAPRSQMIRNPGAWKPPEHRCAK